MIRHNECNIGVVYTFIASQRRNLESAVFYYTGEIYARSAKTYIRVGESQHVADT